MKYENIQRNLEKYMDEFLKVVKLHEKNIFLLGCSTSEVLGSSIGKGTSLETGEVIVNTLRNLLEPKNIFLAVQCCEHLNRALVVERELLDYYSFTEVNAIPVLNAGGGAATAAYSIFKEAVLIEHVTANAGIDIGDTAIGMHIRHVQIPVRTSVKNIGEAHISGLSSRLKLIGGERAVYKSPK